MNKTPVIVWFRNDLRLCDNPALCLAVSSGRPVLPVFIFAPEEEGKWAYGGATLWWLHHSLVSLSEELKGKRVRLVIRKGSSAGELEKLIKESGADSVFWNRRYEPEIIKRDSSITKFLSDKGIKAESFNSHLLFEPWTVKTGQGGPYKVFTAFWNKCLSLPEPEKPLPEPAEIRAPENFPESLAVKELNLLPKIPWDKGMREFWRPGRKGALAVLKEFEKSALENYVPDRDLPDRRGTSRLSPHLHFGEIGVSEVWHVLLKNRASASARKERKQAENYLRQLGWRDFAYHLLYHFPHTVEKPLNEKFARFPWKKNKSALKAWQKGKTGYPIVDAGMRELWKTGWMHNRVRMIAASFLVKDLRVHWIEGALWFWDTLVDADLANNTMGWQWVAGCGADAAPYFRIFNPVSQGEKFDKHGAYVRKWVPELAKLPDKWIHKPWEAPEEVLEKCGIEPGKNYPKPVVDHSEMRRQALLAYDTIK